MGVLIGVIVVIDIILNCVKSYRKRRNKKIAPESKENNTIQCNDHSVRSTEEQIMHQEVEPDKQFFEIQGQNMHMSIKINNYFNIRNNNSNGSKNKIDKRR